MENKELGLISSTQDGFLMMYTEKWKWFSGRRLSLVSFSQIATFTEGEKDVFLEQMIPY